MALRPQGKIDRFFERIVAHPPRATLVVGTTILVLLQVLAALAARWSWMAYLRFLVPYVPPFFITRIAKRINTKRAEHDFVKDAEPHLFVAYPTAPTPEALLATRPEMVSDSSGRHFNCPVDELLRMEILPVPFLAHPEEREVVVRRLLDSYHRDGRRGVLRGGRIHLKPRDREEPREYLMNSVLQEKGGRLKWQATLMRLADEPEEEAP